MSQLKKVGKILHNPNPRRVKVFGSEYRNKISPGAPVLGGGRRRHMAEPRIPGQVDLPKFYKGK